MPVCGSGALVWSSSLLIRRAQRARCQAETPPIVLFKIPEPALSSSGGGYEIARGSGDANYHGARLAPAGSGTRYARRTLSVVASEGSHRPCTVGPRNCIDRPLGGLR